MRPLGKVAIQSVQEMCSRVAGLDLADRCVVGAQVPKTNVFDSVAS